MLTRVGPPLAIVFLTGPILLGFAGTLLPAFGYLPQLGGTGLTLAHAAKLLAEPGIFTSAALSLVSGLVTAAISLLAVMLFVAAWVGTRAFARVRHLISPLLSIPHAAAAFGLAFLIAPSGMIARLISPGLTGWQRPPDLLVVHDPLGIAMMAGLVVKEIPFLLLIALAALPRLDAAKTRALAATLGYGRIAGFLYGLWPPLYRQMRLAVFAVIAFATSVVDVAMILGPTAPPPLAVRLVGWMNDPDLDMRFLASAGAVLQLSVAAIALLCWIGLERLGAAARDRAAVAGMRFRRDAWLRLAALVAMLVPSGAIFGGLAVLCLWSFAGLWQFPHALPESFTMAAWADALPRIAGPLTTTVLVAVLATSAAILLALHCLIRETETGRTGGRWAPIIVYVPLAVPQVAFLFGLQLLFVKSGTVATLPALVLVHLVFVLPYVFLSLSDPWRAYDSRYDAVAAGLGRSRWTTLWRIRLPMLMPAVLTAAAVGFAVSIGQYLPTVLVGAGRLETVTTEAVALASGGNRRIIGVYAFFQMALPALGFLVATAVPALIFRRRRAMRS